ncbi:hypothetical protein F5Y12DRAFT_709873 [Xylaria sp. FL1777]|nr:hypothetical protein F5Y12DRAFT_709873 [Xylaria sp. FL1777]
MRNYTRDGYSGLYSRSSGGGRYRSIHLHQSWFASCARHEEKSMHNREIDADAVHLQTRRAKKQRLRAQENAAHISALDNHVTCPVPSLAGGQGAVSAAKAIPRELPTLAIHLGEHRGRRLAGKLA